MPERKKIVLSPLYVTMYMKLVWPVIGIGVSVWMSSILFQLCVGADSGNFNIGILLVFLSLMAALLYSVFWGLRFKYVECDEKGFYVTSYVGSVFIPYSEIMDVENFRLAHIRQDVVRLTLKQGTRFGRTVNFIAPGKEIFSNRTNDAICEKLREIILYGDVTRVFRMESQNEKPFINKNDTDPNDF